MHLFASGCQWSGMNQVTEPPEVGVLGGLSGDWPWPEAGQGGSEQESHWHPGLKLGL